MTRAFLVSLLLALTGFSDASPAASAQAAQAPPANVPGMPTTARTLIINADRKTEAIPVNVQSAGDVIPVAVMSMPPPAANAVLSIRAARQGWEYQQLSVSAEANPTAALNAAGAEGWEAIGSAAGGPGRTVWILKRPR